MVDFLEPVDIEIVIHTRTGSVQLVPGTATWAGDNIKLHRITSPANIQLDGTPRDFPNCLQPYEENLFILLERSSIYSTKYLQIQKLNESSYMHVTLRPLQHKLQLDLRCWSLPAVIHKSYSG